MKNKFLPVMLKNENVILISFLYRWALFLYAFFLFLLNIDVKPAYYADALLVIFVFIYNLLLTIFYKQIYHRIKANYYLIIFDIVACFVLLLLSGGWGSQFYFYSFSPVFIAAFLFETIGGGFVVAVAMCLIFDMTLFLNGFTMGRIIYLNKVSDLFLFNFNYIVIALVFGYTSSLLSKFKEKINLLDKFRKNLLKDNQVLEDVNNKLNILLKISSAVQLNTSLDNLIELTLNTTINEFGFDRAIMAFWDGRNRKFFGWKLLVKSNLNPEETDLSNLETDETYIANGIFAKVFNEKKLYIVENAKDEPFINKELTFKLNISSYIILPLVHQGKLIGILEADNFLSKKQINDRSVNLLESFSKIVSMGVCNAELFESKRRKLEELSSLHYSMSAIYLKSDFKEIGEVVLNQFRKYFNYERIEIDFIRSENRDKVDSGILLKLKRMVEKGNIYDEKFLRWWEREKINIINDVYKNKKSFIVFKDKDNEYKISGSDNFKGNLISGIILPLISENKNFGFVSMLSAKPVRYSYDNLRLLVIITNQTTVAMENISLNKKRKKLALSEERNRLARDLHDNTAQLLATFLMQLSLYKELIFKDPQKVISGIGNLERLIANILTQSHYFIFPLKTLELKNKIGTILTENLKGFVNDFYDKFSLKINLGINGDMNSLSIAVQAGVLPIIRELLYNIAKHAYVKEADVRINILSGRLEIVVEDRGRGFNLGLKKEQAKKQKHLGLSSVEERSKALGGSVVFEAVIGGGTKVVLSVPVDQAV